MVKAIIWDLLGTLGGNSSTLIHKGFEFFDCSLPALKKAQDHHFLNFIVTNQSHIAHGRIKEKEYTNALERILEELHRNDIEIEEIFTCPHSKKDACKCKKPKPFFVEKAIENYSLDRENLFVIGDSGKNDMMLAKNVGANSILVKTGEGLLSLSRDNKIWGEGPTYIADNCLEAVNIILSETEN